MLFFRKTYVFGYLLKSPRRGDSNKYTKRMIYEKISVLHALDGSISSFFITANSILQKKTFGNKRCRYNEGPLYYIYL